VLSLEAWIGTIKLSADLKKLPTDRHNFIKRKKDRLNNWLKQPREKQMTQSQFRINVGEEFINYSGSAHLSAE
jgi:hypothetical protein